MVGAMYWRKPIKESEILLAPMANSSKGIAVAAPAPISKKVVSSCVKLNELENAG